MQELLHPYDPKLSGSGGGILTMSQCPFTTLISIFSPGLMTRFSHQPIALAGNFPSAVTPSSKLIAPAPKLIT